MERGESGGSIVRAFLACAIRRASGGLGSRERTHLVFLMSLKPSPSSRPSLFGGSLSFRAGTRALFMRTCGLGRETLGDSEREPGSIAHCAASSFTRLPNLQCSLVSARGSVFSTTPFGAGSTLPRTTASTSFREERPLVSIFLAEKLPRKQRR